MTSTIELDPSDESRVITSQQNKPKPLGSSLAAAAARITSKKIEGMGRSGKAESWQEDAWDMFDLVGEERFLATTLANRLAQARFFVGKLPQNTTEKIETLTEGPAYEAFDTLVGHGDHFNQMVQRLGVNLFIPGDGYLVGIPKTDNGGGDAGSPKDGITPIGTPVEDHTLGDIDIKDLKWRMISVSEINFESSGEVSINDDAGNKCSYNANSIFVIRVWRPHPRRWWQADSPTRSSLPVLRELVGLTMKISANIDSRLAGSGIFLIPASADQAIRAAAGAAGDDDLSPLAEALMDAMIAPITDRSNANSVVPIMPVVPDESIEKFRYISFSSPLEAEDRANREEAIRRLALGQDCPPELLLGVSGMNHWGAWLVREDVVTTHLEPPLALICDAVTTQFLWPILQEQGIEDYDQFVVWYDVDHLIMRPNRSADAIAVHAAGELSGAALRDATGFDETSAPEADPTDPITKLILDMIRDAPSLMQTPGLAVIADQVRALVEGNSIPATPTPESVEVEGTATEDEEAPVNEDEIPSTSEDAPSVVASSALKFDRVWCGMESRHDYHEWEYEDEFVYCPGI